MNRDVAIGLADLLAQVSMPMMLSPEPSVCIDAAGKLAEIIEDLRHVARAKAEIEHLFWSTPRYTEESRAADQKYLAALDRLQVEHKRKK